MASNLGITGRLIRGIKKNLPLLIFLLAFLLSILQFMTIGWHLGKSAETFNFDFIASSTVSSSSPRVPAASSGVSATTIVTNTGTGGGKSISCYCNIANSTDCLKNSIACIPRTRGAILSSIARGMATRAALRETSQFVDDVVDDQDDKYVPFLDPERPIGKSAQYATIEGWDRWTSQNQLRRSNFKEESVFVNASMYPDCIDNELVGKACFFHPIADAEILYTDPLEVDAASPGGADMEETQSAKLQLDRYKADARIHGQTLPALDHLLVFAQIARMHFNIRKPIIESYEKHLVIIKPKSSASPEEADTNDILPLRVSLHVRRADSCEHQKQDVDLKTISDGKLRYLQNASDINSPAQVTGKRYCYDTAVYMDALRCLQQHEQKQSLEIYLSTDYAGELLNDIQTNFPKLYESVTWKYLNFPRDAFIYVAAIEMNENRAKHGFLGETAVADLWHLSHGQVFIGHIGSRFGKVAWLLATAKYNTFIPYFTVDGRTYCCEIDENCGLAAPMIGTMEHCLTFAHDIAARDNEYDAKEDIETYWTLGSTVRKRHAALRKDRLEELMKGVGAQNSWIG